MFKLFLRNNKNQLISIAAAFMAVGLLLNTGVFDLQASLFSNLKSAPFDGTALPIKKIPSWVDLSADQWKLPYSQIPQNKIIDLPEYNASKLAIPQSSLKYSNAADKAIRNAQVTFSVPYLGDYKLDGLENAGSHPGIDIKIPLGTPVYAIANAVVIKADNQPGGYGQYVVLRHDNVPSLDNPGIKTTYYSGYAHLSKFSVTPGDLVVKGQQIGESGMTGTATTPHLHFQIDNDQAPWHLYWPFTSKEAADAGLGFFEAINAGLGKDKASAATINAMMFVQKNLSNSTVNNSVTASSNSNNQPVVDELPPVVNTSSTTNNVVSSESNTAVNNSTVGTDELPPVGDSTEVSTEKVVETALPAADFEKFELKYDKSFAVNSSKEIKLIAMDKNGAIINDFKANSEVYIKVESGSAILSKSYLTSDDFNAGIASVKITPIAKFGLTVSFTYNGQRYATEVMQESGFSDVLQSNDNFVAINFLRTNGVVGGYPDGSFKPDNDISRVEALKFIYEGLNKDVLSRGNLEFSDTDSGAWYANYVATAQKEGIVKGYQNNKFRPASPVTKAEFVKMLIVSAGFDASNYVASSASFSDVTPDAWYANYIALAKDKNLLNNSSNQFKPNQPITRAEVAQILYRVIVTKLNSKLKYEENLVVNDDLARNFYNI